jgi:HAD superfamily hydrolase (TIGR01549 family)
VIRAVLFDLDDTLFDHQYCASAALGGVRSLHPRFEEMNSRELEAAHARILETLHADVMTGQLELEVARIERFRRLYEYAGIAADTQLAERTAACYRDAYVTSRRAIAGAAELLTAVRCRAKVGIVSNNLLEEQREKLKHCGLDGYCEVLVVSEEAGVAKPDPRIFTIALDRLGCDPGETVMVGDSWSADIVGAIAAGIRPIWFNRNGASAPDGATHVDTIDSLEPAEAVVRKIFGEPAL